MEIAGDPPRRRSSASSSPEFEFSPSTNPDDLPLLSADELFADGILVPLHFLSLNPPPIPSSPAPATPPQPPASRWKEIFRSGPKKPSAEINIKIWPFSRSRSSGNGRHRFAAARKTSSAPCSRCNSHGESGSSPVRGRAGRVYLGRSSPVWQIRRRAVGGGRRENGGAGVGRVLNFNVNTCIGHQRMMTSCRDCEKGCERVSGEENRGNGDGGGEEGEVNGGLFKLKAIFARKVY